jgi:hypothetical protein
MTSSGIRAPQPVPRSLAGKWLTWTPNGLFVLGSGKTPNEALKAAHAHGPDPTIDWVPSMGVAYEWVPPADERFLGPASSP